MTVFYSSVFQHRGKLLVTEINNGRRVRKSVPYAPYLFVEDPNGDYQTVFGKPLSKMEFTSIKDAREFTERYGDVSNFSIHGFSNWPYQYIYENYQQSVYDRVHLNIGFLDIETDVEGGYPDTETIQGEKAITMISLEVNGEMWSFGLKDFDTSNLPHVRYFKFDSEVQMLRQFVRIWEKLQLDAVSGWNIQGFDIPYIICRLRRVLGEDWANKLSPWGVIQEREFLSTFGKTKTAYTILGVAELDYMELYKKFTVPLKGRPESFSLDYIAHSVLGTRKLDYSEYGNLGELYKRNPQLYAEYNVRDVDLVVDIDKEMGLIDIALTIAYQTGVNLADVFGTVRPWDCAIHRYLMDRKTVVPYQKLTDKDFKIKGGFVPDVLVGLHRWVASFDFASLYPHVIMMWNIGPETLRRRIEGIDSEKLAKRQIDVEQLLGPNEVLGGNGCVFDTTKKSFLAALMEDKFGDRARYKDLMLDAQKHIEAATEPDDRRYWESQKVRYDNLQHATKILLNSVYGALANAYFRWFDPYLAECITQSGQTATISMVYAINKLMNNLLGTTGLKFVIAADTDSAYVSCERFIDSVVKDQTNVKQTIGILDAFCKKTLKPAIDNACSEVATYLHAPNQKLNMKRECLANKGIWTGKKHYILNVYDKEGVAFSNPERKIVGIEAIRSSTPGAAREAIKQAIDVILDKEERDLYDFISSTRQQFSTLPIQEIAFPRGANDIDKWKGVNTLVEKGTPIQAKSAIYHNQLLNELKITEFAPIKSGDKIKFVYLKKHNPYNINVIGFSSILPPAFGLDAFVDRNLQFEKSFLEPMKSITNAIGWNTQPTATLDAFFV